MPSGMELFVIAAVILLLFGGKKIPELAKGLGSGIKNFKKAIKDDEVEAEGSKDLEKIEKADASETIKSEAKDKAAS